MSRGKQMKACTREEVCNGNLITEMPDEILVRILSSLTYKEAGRTRILSKRWIPVWPYITTLNFDSFFMYGILQRRSNTLHLSEMVNQVIKLHKAPTIDELRVQFDIFLDDATKISIDDLLSFAMEKKVKRLQMDFSSPRGCTVIPPIRYTFPSLSCNSLTSVELSDVDITGEILQSFLCNCLALEYLTVKTSNSLVELKVSGALLGLKCLSLYHCLNIRHMEISAPNLVSLCYYGPKINVLFRSVPKLAQVSFGSYYADDLTNACSDVSNICSQIKVLCLDTSNHIQYLKESLEGLVFTRLKKLDVLASPKSNDNLDCFISLINASPFLQHFKLRLDTLSYRKRIMLRKREACTHNHLKIVEIVGFVGYAIDLEFAAYLMESALDTIIVDTRDLDMIRTSKEYVTRKRKRAMKQAELLREYCKPGTKLEIF